MIVRSKANTILNDIFSKNYYIGLSTTTPTEEGSNFKEPTATEYKRVKLSVMGTAGNPYSGQIQNDDIIFFPEAITSWGTITHFGIFTSLTASSAPTPIYWGKLNAENGVTIAAEYVPIFRAGALKIGLDKDVLE